MFVSCVFAVLPKCASKGVMRVVVLGISLMFSIMCVILSANVSLSHLASMFIAESRLFIVCIIPSTSPVPLWSPAGAKINLMLLSLQKISKFFDLNSCAWSHLNAPGMP